MVNDDDSTMSVIDEATSTITATISAGTEAASVGVDPATHVVYAADFTADNVLVIPVIAPGASGIFVRSYAPACEGDLATQGPGNTLDYYWATPGSPWSSAQVGVPGSTYSAPSLFVEAGGEAHIAAEGPGNTLDYYWATPGGPNSWNFAPIAGPGSIYSAPSIFVRAGGEADIAAEGPRNTLVYYRHPRRSVDALRDRAGPEPPTRRRRSSTGPSTPRRDGHRSRRPGQHPGLLLGHWRTPGRPFRSPAG